MSHRHHLRFPFLEKLPRVVVWLLLLIGGIAFLSPLYLMLAIALKTPWELAITSSWQWPKHPTFDNFITVLTNPNVSFLLFFKNSVVISTLTTLGVVLSSSFVAYPFARLNFRGKDRLFILLLSTMMLPNIVTLIPTYVIYKHLQWVNTFYPLILPSFFGDAFSIFLLCQFFKNIPKEIDEAAMIDGASHWTIFWKMILPLSKPVLTTVMVFAFIYSWRDFLGPLIYLNDPEKQTLELGLRTYQNLHFEQWHLLMAGSVLVMIPILVIFAVGQRYFIKGIVMTGFK